MGEIAFNLHFGKPESQPLGGGVDVGELGVEAFVGFFFQVLDVEGAGGVGDEDDSLQVVDLDEKVELGAGGAVEVLGGGDGGVDPGGAAGDGEAVVAWNAELLVAEFVEGFAESAVGAVDGHGVDALGVPWVFGGENRSRQARGGGRFFGRGWGNGQGAIG